MLRGIAATLALQTTIAGRLRRGRRLTGLFELDEAALPNIVAQVQPRIIVVTNLFRDQLDRYGELQAIADHWRTAIHQLPSSVLVVLNADDPLVANLATAAPGPVLFFGIDQWGTALTDAAVRPTFSADSVYCPRCGASLHFAQISYAHLGHYYCPACDFRRPTPDVVATAVTVGPDYSNFTVTIGATTIPCHVPLPGRYNAYNALAALSAAYVTRIPLPVAITAIGAAKGAFGRAETVQAQGRTVRLFLIKNPTGADEVLNVISTAPHDAALLVLLNDNAADGEDVSWIWDVRFDVLATWTGPLRCGGTRADDIALRLKYAGLPKAEVVQPGDLRATVLDAISATPIGHTLYIVATYTAMLAARDAMARQGYVAQYWQDSA